MALKAPGRSNILIREKTVTSFYSSKPVVSTLQYFDVLVPPFNMLRDTPLCLIAESSFNKKAKVKIITSV